MQMEMSTINAAGATIAVRRCGAGPAVVCLHATGHSGRDFERFAERLQGQFQFYCLDWPGQGESPREDRPASAACYAEILEGAMEALGIDKCILLGNSIGGAAAITYAAQHPEKVRGMVLCNTGGLVAVNWIVQFYCNRLARRFARGAKGDRRFPKWFARYYRKVLTEPAAAWRREEIIASAARIAPVLAEAWRSFGRREADIRRLVPKLTMPVLYAWGIKDKAIRWSWVEKAAVTAPNHEIAFFPAGHAAFLEQPEDFERSFLAFAERCE